MTDKGNIFCFNSLNVFLELFLMQGGVPPLCMTVLKESMTHKNLPEIGIDRRD